MRLAFRIAALTCMLALTPAASAHPGAAPWEADGRPGRDSCATCHFESEPALNSGKLQLLGLPQKVEAGRTYELTVALKHAGMKVAGFLLGLDPAGAGAAPFKATSSAIESKDAAIRSTLARAKQTEEARWSFAWRAPDKLPAEIVFYLSANAGNDDQSPLGDRIYLETVKLKASARPGE
jgi:hypothetical protein